MQTSIGEILSDVPVYFEHTRASGSFCRFGWMVQGKPKIIGRAGSETKKVEKKGVVNMNIGCYGCVGSVWLDYAKPWRKEGGMEGRREREGLVFGVGSFHDSVKLQPRCLGEGEGQRQILDHVDPALRGVVALGGDQAERPQIVLDCSYLPRATHPVGMSASHTTPSPSIGLASGGVPTEAS